MGAFLAQELQRLTPAIFCPTLSRELSMIHILCLAILIFAQAVRTTPEKPTVVTNDASTNDAQNATSLAHPKTEDKHQPDSPGGTPQETVDTPLPLKQVLGTDPIHLDGRIVYKSMPIKKIDDDEILKLESIHTSDDGQIYLLVHDRYRSSAILTSDGDWLPPLEGAVEGSFAFETIHSETFAKLTHYEESEGGCSCLNPSCGAIYEIACIDRLMNLKGQWIGSEPDSTFRLYDSPEYIQMGGPFALVSHPSCRSDENSYSCELYAIHSAKRLNQIDLVACKDMSQELFPVKTADSGGLWGYMNPRGELVIPDRYEYADHFVNGRAAIKIDGQYGYIDKHGDTVITPQFQWTGFDGSVAKVKLTLEHAQALCRDANNPSNKPNAQFLAACKTKSVFSLWRKVQSICYNMSYRSSDYCDVWSWNYWVSEADDIKECVSYETLLENAGFEKDLCHSCKDICHSCWDSNTCDRIAPNGQSRLLHRGWALIDAQGKVISRFDYDKFEPFRENGFAYVKRGNWEGYIDKNGKEYDSIDDEDNDET